MSFMNFFDVNNEIKNLNNIITNLNKENNTLKDNFSSLNNTVNDVQMNKLDKVDIVNAVDEIKEECKYYEIQDINGVDFVTYSCSESTYKGKIGFAINDGSGIILQRQPD